MEEQIDQIINTVLKYEDPDLDQKKKKKYQKWFHDICKPEQNLIEGLIATFIERCDDPEISRRILKCLKKLNENFYELVNEQFFNNLKFPKALIQYLENTNLENIAGDAFILLINLYDDESTPLLISDKFLAKLIQCLEFIQDEGTLNFLVQILMCLAPHYEQQINDTEKINDEEKNPIIKEFIQKESFYREKILHLANRSNQYNLEKCCETINIILGARDDNISNYFFNINDLNLIMDILMREVSTNQSSKTRIAILKLLQTLLNNKTYRDYKYRMDEVETMIVESILYNMDENQDIYYRDYEMEQVASLNQFFQVEKKKNIKK